MSQKKRHISFENQSLIFKGDMTFFLRHRTDNFVIPGTTIIEKKLLELHHGELESEFHD